MRPTSERLRWHLIGRPILGYAVARLWPEPPYRPPPSTVCIVRHARYGTYLRSPYRDTADDPRYRWTTKPRRAARFAHRRIAERVLLEIGEPDHEILPA